MGKLTKTLVSGVASAIILAGALSVPQIQAAVSNKIQPAKIQKAKNNIIRVTDTDLAQMKSALEKEGITLSNLKELGSYDIKRDEPASKSYTSVEQAKKAGYDLPLSTPQGYRFDGISVKNPYSVEFTLNANQINDLLRKLNVDVQLGNELDGKKVTVNQSEAVSTKFSKNNSAHGLISYEETKIPQIDTNIDKEKLLALKNNQPLEKLKNSKLISIIPQNILKQLVGRDWQNMNGEEGFLQFKQKDQHGDGFNRTLYWKEGDTLRKLQGEGNVSAKDLLKLAKSIH
ncbi:hypothetical protein SAMN05444487_106144 [Marininema mesophilum]|uniref:Uncharacterized protein n=1 Tax=Marininema mesophilum TaxID=1048340 RepID=A0A1H2WI82_9BACL|nr:hypothetical protein [Marininema mesophilum]SDW80362.1 hypothetical protein SAMN05444487_106144 [Marininema mesophilum]